MIFETAKELYLNSVYKEDLNKLITSKNNQIADKLEDLSSDCVENISNVFDAIQKNISSILLNLKTVSYKP